MRSRKRRNVYAELAEHFGKDQVLIRKVAHHPFEFIHQKMTDEYDHRAIRLRYLGLFFIKGAWRKQMNKHEDIPAPEGVRIYVRIPFLKNNRKKYYLHVGMIENGVFVSEQGPSCPSEDISYWKGIE